MPESRDRLSRPVDIAAIYARRLSGALGIYQDQPDLETALFGSPLPRPNAAVRAGTLGAGALGHGRGGLDTPRGQTGRGRNLHGVLAIGRENTPIGSAHRGNGGGRAQRGNGGGRASNSVLPLWYPRTPLRDITAVVRSIERRRERLGGEGQESRSPMIQGLRVPVHSEASPVAYREGSSTTMSPIPSFGVKRCPPTVGKVPKILLDVTNQASGETEFLTPQKKLLNSIDKVEKVVMEELRKLKRTPSAKKAEREKRVRTLMSMR